MKASERRELEARAAAVEAAIGVREHELDNNRKRIAYLRERDERVTDELVGLRAELRDVRGRLPARRGAREGARVAAREAAVQIGVFTVPEFAAQAGISEAAAKRAVKEMVQAGSVRATGERFAARPIFEYVRPGEAGAAFDVQQRLRAVPDPIGAGAASVAGTGGRSELDALHKDVRAVVRRALDAGWTFHRTGTDHFQLRRGGEIIGVAGTPANPSGSANIIADKLRRADRAPRIA